MFTSLDDLYISRCRLTESGYKPTFWSVGEITKEPYTLYGDERRLIKPEWGVEEAISKILALNYFLELPVGEFVSNAAKRELPDSPHVRSLLKSNIADEARHFEGFDLACKAYQPEANHFIAAEAFKNKWEELSETSHPLMAPLVLEVGLFLASLGFLRVCGGKSLATLAAKVSEDESRHVITNRSLLQNYGENAFNPPQRFVNLLKETLEWIFQSVSIPRRILGVKWDVDYFLSVSNDLLTTGDNPRFNSVVYISDHRMPFELSNCKMYDRVLA